MSAAVLVVLATGLPAHAQESSTTGLFLNAHLNGASISYDLQDLGGSDDETHTGGGLGVQIGYGFSPLVTLYLAANGSSMSDDDIDSYTLFHVDLGVQFNFRSGERSVPYANLAFSARQTNFEVDLSQDGNGTSNDVIEIDFSGGGVTVGGGVKYFLVPQVALDVGLLGTFGTFTEVDFGPVAFDIDEINATSFRLAVGASWFPSR